MMLPANELDCKCVTNNNIPQLFFLFFYFQNRIQQRIHNVCGNKIKNCDNDSDAVPKLKYTVQK